MLTYLTPPNGSPFQAICQSTRKIKVNEFSRYALFKLFLRVSKRLFGSNKIVSNYLANLLLVSKIYRFMKQCGHNTLNNHFIVKLYVVL